MRHPSARALRSRTAPLVRRRRLDTARRTARGGLLALVTVLALAGCAAGTAIGPHSAHSSGTPTDGDWTLPPTGAIPDYQLGGAYEPAAGVGIVGRDRSAEPAPDTYSICYVNGFQTQPGELDTWDADLLLQHDGQTAFDPDWPDEALLDTSTFERRERIAAQIIPWIEECANDGFAAVEFDNLDSYTRSDDALSLDDNLALAALFVDAAHGTGLAAGQKNAAEDAAALRDRAGFDFAVTEECAAFEECAGYAAVYGDHVIDIEYSDELPRRFVEMCAHAESPASMVLRDRDLVTPDDPAYVFQTCGD